MPRKSFFALWSHYKAYLITALSLFVCIVFFQNCTSELDLEEGSEDKTSLSDSTPFAFDVSIDHFALMTCHTDGLGHGKKNGQFTYKWGAFQNGMATPGIAGLRFSDNFMSKYGRKVPGKVFTVLEDSPKNTNLEVISGLYKSGAYTRREGYNDSSYRNDHTKLQVNSYRMDLSLNMGKTLAYFPNVSVSAGINRNIEGVMFRKTHSSSNALVGDYKDEFTAAVNEDRLSVHPVVIGFGHATELARGEAKSLIGEGGGYSNEAAIGRSYLPMMTGVRSTHLRYLDKIRESKVDGTALASSWGCPSRLRFKIVPREDITAGEDGQIRHPTCIPQLIRQIDLSPNTTRGMALRSIANVLDLTMWEVGLDLSNSANNCIVRRGNIPSDSCYAAEHNPYVNSLGRIKSDTEVIRVDYSSNQSICGSSNPIRNEPYKIGGQNRETFYMCPHYVSVCVKYN